MNIAVLAPPDKDAELLSILRTMQDLGIPAFGLKIRKAWDQVAPQGLAVRIGKASHILLVCTPHIVEEPWFVFVSGFSLGKNAPLALCRLDPDWVPPAYLSRVPLLDTELELTEFYRIEKAEWEVEEGKRVARSSLLERGISFHAEALAQCVAEGDALSVELFLKAGFNANSRDRHGVPLLCLAARNRHLGMAELLLSWGASLDLQSEDRGYSALMDASLAGSPELVDLFLDYGAVPNLQSKDGQTALVIAVGRSDAVIARRLLEKGADADMVDKLGFSARKYVNLFKKPDLLAIFEAATQS